MVKPKGCRRITGRGSGNIPTTEQTVRHGREIEIDEIDGIAIKWYCSRAGGFGPGRNVGLEEHNNGCNAEDWESRRVEGDDEEDCDINAKQDQ
ncbi:hypothetical protein FocnCong_v016297 [Fusarium oxysporum f. sp. conglutinans]|nr:hypothetical protein FocnCong_v016297 [Fusarium oxysporum f. sp. conglutinans]